MSRIRFTVLSFSLLAFLFLNGRPALSQQYQSSPTDWVLEVTYHGGRPPAYQPVPAHDAKLNGSWYASFGQLASWQPPAGFLPVQAVNILSRQEGDAIRVVVSVFVGAKNFEKEEPVGTYLLHENERVATARLTGFGVEPFEIKATKVFPVSSNLPQIVNRTQSLVVTNIEVNDSTLASYKLRVRNLSGKNVAAVGLNVFVNNRRRLASMRQGTEGQALIAAGSDYELKIPGANNAHPGGSGYTPDAPSGQEIRINSVVFEDGSYEGDPETAVAFSGFKMGRKIQMGRIVPLMKEALNDLAVNNSRALENFKARLGSLGVEADPADAERFLQEFPNFDEKARADLKTSIEVALNGVKFDLVKSLQELERFGSQPPAADSFRAWLSKNLESYERWLSRL